MAFIKNIEHEEIVRLRYRRTQGRSSVKHWRRTAASVSRCSLLQKERRLEHTILQATRWSQSSKEKADSW